MTDNARLQWSVLMPVKVLARAKSRLAGLAGPRRGELALAVACDTVAAALRCASAARVIVITDDRQAAATLGGLGALVVPDEPGDGLNAALLHGAAHAAARWPGCGTAALSADLPALRPVELERALSAAAQWPNAFVPDAAGHGTTLYTAAPAAAFRPAFGLESRARHAAGGAAELALPDIPGLRRDVDTPADLRIADALGLGARSAPLAAELLAAELLRCAPRGR
jgi:2-phospho-L-lactate/phosphoenolpyruvate guanylyltransferase